MSALRVSRPGYPVQLIDLGPSVGRVTHAKTVIAGWSIAPTMTLPTEPDATSEVRREQNAAAAKRYRAGKK